MEMGGLCRKSLLIRAEAFGGGTKKADLTRILPSSLLKVLPISHAQQEARVKEPLHAVHRCQLPDTGWRERGKW